MPPSPQDPSALPAQPDPLLPELLDHRYRTGRVLGRGGMARVYLAHDVKHGRDVAVKVIRPELSLSLAHDRFLREIEIAARLRHPNIVPLYDSGEVDGSLYFVMPYEEGPSLRERLAREGPLPLAEALGVLRDVGRALAYAHDHGVVHRDIKSDNVMLSGGAAVVTDFGIAKAVSAAIGDTSATLTQTGSSIGTPAYMSPEQATGDPATDHRTDIYAFGCLAFEVYTGNPPFHTLSTHQLIAAHITTVPASLAALRPEVPPAVAELVAHCLEKDAAARPQSAMEVLAALERTTPAPRDPRPSVTAAPSHGAASPRRPVLALLAALLGLAAFLATRGGGSAVPISLAVLPFGNIAADSALDGVAAGLADEVAAVLTQVPGIQLKSRSGARAYRGQLGIDVTEAGMRLQAEYLVTGVMRREGGNWLVSAEFARAADAASLWTRSFVLSPDQGAGNAQAIAESLVTALRDRFPRVIGAAPPVVSSRRSSNSEAYWLWVRGEERLNRRGRSVRESADLFRQALREDSLFAPAYSGLSMALALFPHFQDVTVDAVRDDVESNARRALKLDPTLSQPHVALGMLYQFDYRWEDAAAEYQTAIQLDSRSVEARIQYARHLLFRGRTSEAMDVLRPARAADPANAVVLAWMSYAYYLDRRLDSALVQSRRAVETDSASFTAAGTAAMIRMWSNRPEEARPFLDRLSPLSAENLYFLGRFRSAAAARELLRQHTAAPPHPTTVEYERAIAHIGLGDTAGALSALERATDAREIWGVLQPITAPYYDDLRGSARFRALARRIGLADVLAGVSAPRTER